MDFGTAPYYGFHVTPDVQVAIGSIQTDRNFNAITDAGDSIEGLYVVGVEGAMLWSNIYTINIAGGANANNVNSGRQTCLVAPVGNAKNRPPSEGAPLRAPSFG